LDSSSKIKDIVVHISAWFVFLYLPIYLEDGGHEFTNDPLPLLVEILDNLLLIGLFYLNTNFLIPRFFKEDKFIQYSLWIVMSLVVFTALEVLKDFYSFEPDYFEEQWHVGVAIVDGLFPLLMILALSTSYRLIGMWVKNEQLRKESELKLLKSQINPHFLFNSLNTLYALINNKQFEKAEEATLTLSALLRYSVYKSDHKKISLPEEIEYIENYISLQKLRLPERVKITVTFEGDFNNLSIEPMLLIPFIENAFKHGISYQNNSEVLVKLVSQDKQLHLTVKNTINSSKEKKDKYSGVGLINVKQRLQLLYPKNHTLEILKDDNWFIVRLTLSFLSSTKKTVSST